STPRVSCGALGRWRIRIVRTHNRSANVIGPQSVRLPGGTWEYHATGEPRAARVGRSPTGQPRSTECAADSHFAHLAAGGLPPDVDALLGALRTRRDRAMVEVMLFGGLRRCEVLGLRLADVNIGERRLFISQGKGGRQ